MMSVTDISGIRPVAKLLDFQASLPAQQCSRGVGVLSFLVIAVVPFSGGISDGSIDQLSVFIHLTKEQSEGGCEWHWRTSTGDGGTEMAVPTLA
jgi:hypothetical protein